MIRDWFENAGALLVGWPALLGCLLFTHACAALVGYLMGSGDRVRDGRAEVRSAVEGAASGRIGELVPKQTPRAD